MSTVLSPEKLMAIVDGDEEFLEEMKVAQIQTLDELRSSFASHLMEGNKEGLRSANHKAKPAIELLGAEALTNLVQEAYNLLEADAGEGEKKTLITKMDDTTNKVMDATRELSL